MDLAAERAEFCYVRSVLRHGQKLGGRLRLLHKEYLAPGVAPEQRIAELVLAVNDDTYHPR